MPARQPEISVAHGIVADDVPGEQRQRPEPGQAAVLGSGGAHRAPRYGPGPLRRSASRAAAPGGGDAGHRDAERGGELGVGGVPVQPVAQAPARTWLTFGSGRPVIALASRYPAAVVCGHNDGAR